MKWGLWCEVARQGAAGALAAVGLHEEAVRVTTADPWSLAEALAAAWARCWPAGHLEPARISLDARGAIWWAGAMIGSAKIGDQPGAQAARKAMETYTRRLGVKVDPSLRTRL